MFLPDWLATNPGVDIALEERLSYEIAPAVAQGHADIGVLVPADSAGVEGLETFPFRIDRLVVIVPRGHALAGRRNIAFVDLLDEEFVGLVAGSALAEHLGWQSTRLGRSLKPRIRLRGLDAVCRMVESRVGIAVVPETAATRCRQTMAVNASWPISETANPATRTRRRLPHGGVSCGDCRRTGNGRYALSAKHGTQYTSTHGYMGSAAIDRLCTPQGGAASTYTPIGRAPGRYSQNGCVICEAVSK